MKVIISTTYDDKYLFFLPIVTWCWNKLGVDVVCFAPRPNMVQANKLMLINSIMGDPKVKCDGFFFDCPEHKEATYSQCSRLYAAALDLPDDEWLITSDIDMAVFREPVLLVAGNLGGHENVTVVGHDLTPDTQYPMCYCCASVKGWREFMKINGKSYQQCLDDILGPIECESFRGNYWSRDQEELFNRLNDSDVWVNKAPRARPGTQFASNRLDRDDSFLLDRLNPDIIDYHMPRPGFEESNFNQILTVLKYFYPSDNFDWLVNYKNEYLKLL